MLLFHVTYNLRLFLRSYQRLKFNFVVLSYSSNLHFNYKQFLDIEQKKSLVPICKKDHLLEKIYVCVSKKNNLKMYNFGKQCMPFMLMP
jgi:hypothetical protein